MGTGISIFFIAVGAILAFAVNLDNNTSGIDLDAIGVILMVVGVLGLLFSLVVWDNIRPGRRADYADDRDVVARRDVVVDEEPVARRRSYTR